jgi:hypothetical protein
MYGTVLDTRTVRYKVLDILEKYAHNIEELKRSFRGTNQNLRGTLAYSFEATESDLANIHSKIKSFATSYGSSLIKNTKSQFMNHEWCRNKVLSTVKITHYYGESFHEDADKVPVPHYYDDDFVDEYSNKTDYDPNQKPGQDRHVRDPKRQSPNKASSTLSEAFVVKHDIMGRSKETFETIEDAIKHINDGMKDVTAEHFILEEDGKRLVFIDISYGGNGGPAGWITWVLSQNKAKDLLGFDEEKGLFLIDH